MLLGTFLRVFYVTSPPFVAQFCLSGLVLAQWYWIFKHFTMNTTYCSSLLVDVEAATRSRGCCCLLAHKDGQARPGLGEQGMIAVWEGEGGGGGGG